jgi:hypothetical protein
MNIQLNALRTALDLVLPATGDSKIEGADAAVFSDGWVHTYSSEQGVSISAPVPDLAGLTAAIKAKELSRVVKKLKGDVVEISKTETFLSFTCGTTEGEIILQPDTLSHALASLGLSDLEELWQPVPMGMRTAIALVRLENHREQFPVVRFSGDLVVAVTASRWNYGTVHGDPMPAFSVHTEAAKTLLTLGELSRYAVRDLWAHWQTEAGTVFSAKIQDGDGFPTKKVLGTLNDIKLTPTSFSVAMPKDLGDKVAVVSVFSSEDQKSGTPMVEVTVKGKEIRLATANSGGKVKDKCILDAAVPDSVEVVFQASVPYLEEAAKKVTTMSVVPLEAKTKSGDTVIQPRLVFQGQDFTQVISVDVK